MFMSRVANELAAKAKKPESNVKKVPIAGGRPSSSASGPLAQQTSSAKTHRTPTAAPKGPPPRPVIREKARNKKDPVKSIRSSSIRTSSPATPPATRLQSDDEGDDSEDEDLQPRKKRKTDSADEVQDTRTIRDMDAFSTEDIKAPDIVHMANIANVGTPQNPSETYVPLFTALSEHEDEAPTLQLRYPSSQLENYQLVVPKSKSHGNNHSGSNDDVNPFAELRSVMWHIAKYYMDASKAKDVVNEDSGIVTRLRRLEKQERYSGKQTQYTEVVTEFNKYLSDLHRDGTLSKCLGELERLPLGLIEHILDQIYARTVSPEVHVVRKYKAFDDSVYGELRPKFLNRIFKETKLRSDQIFVDLGHGVGNCVLQAALEIGCESYGCEKQEQTAQLGDKQAKEFPERCRMWGIKPGKVRLIHGDFLENEEINSILRRADVVLINNQAFNPPLMDALKLKFLDLKNGCQIVCLKPFRDTHFKTRHDNISDPQNIIDVAEHFRYKGDVDWADADGKWYIHRKDEKYTTAFVNRR